MKILDRSGMGDLPAMWKVFSVICVDGSPTDCAAMTPTASPGGARALMYLMFMSSLNSSSFPIRASGEAASSSFRCSHYGH